MANVLVNAFAAFIDAATSTPTLFTAALAENGFSNEQILGIMLVAQFVVIATFHWLAVHWRTGGKWDRVALFRLGLVYLIVFCAVAIECRVLFIRLPEGVSGVYDVGHESLSPFLTLMNSNKYVNEVVAALNSMLVLGGTVYGTYIMAAKADCTVLVKCCWCGFIRMLTGVLTRLPVPSGYVSVSGDFPPENENCKGFIFCPSGHVIGMFMLSLHMRRRGEVAGANFIDVMNVLQTVRLIALRGHYTVDVIMAIIIVMAVEPRVEESLWGAAPAKPTQKKTSSAVGKPPKKRSSSRSRSAKKQQ